MTTTLLVLLIVPAWIGVGPFLGWFMSRRGYDYLSWLSVGSILGPSALALAFIERVWGIPTAPEVVVRGSPREGPIHLLLSLDHGEDVVSVARPILEELDGYLGRVCLVRVLPEAGPVGDQDRARSSLKREALRLADYGAEAVLMFGRVGDVIKEKALSERFLMVLTERCSPTLASALPRDVPYLAGRTEAEQTAGSESRRTPTVRANARPDAIDHHSLVS